MRHTFREKLVLARSLSGATTISSGPSIDDKSKKRGEETVLSANERLSEKVDRELGRVTTTDDKLNKKGGGRGVKKTDETR